MNDDASAFVGWLVIVDFAFSFAFSFMFLFVVGFSFGVGFGFEFVVWFVFTVWFVVVVVVGFSDGLVGEFGYGFVVECAFAFVVRVAVGFVVAFAMKPTRRTKMRIDDMTIGEARELTALFGGANSPTGSPWKLGAYYAIRTVTMIQTGELVAVYPTELVLTSAAWIADTGRWANFLLDPAKNAKEVEPFPPTARPIIGRQAIIDACIIPSLPQKQK